MNLRSLLKNTAILATMMAVALAPSALLAADDNLFANGNFEADSKAAGWPDGWPRAKAGGSWETEAGNHFLRLKSGTPGSMVMLYQQLQIPADAKALQLTWRWRSTDLKPGAQAWFDARIMMDFKDANGQKLKPSPSAPYMRKSTDAWVERTISFLVPAGAQTLDFMPALFQVESGTLDLDDVVIKITDPAPLEKAAADKAAALLEKQANQIAARTAKAASLLAATGSLITNGNFEVADKAGQWPSEWPNLKENGSWETETDGNRFLRIKSTAPDKTVVAFRSLVIPTGVQALELAWRWRISDLKPGKMPWFDARIMMDVKDMADKKLKPQPSAPYSRRNSKDGAWETKSVSFLVPEGGVILDFMPSLFSVKQGTLDLDDIVIKPTDPAPVIARQKERESAVAKTQVPSEEPNKEKWPAELRVVGNKIQTAAGADVWLQGLNIPSLEWSLGGEQVLKSTVVAIEQWKSNVIRIPVKDDYWFGEGGQSDGGKAYRDLVDQMITLASNRGAYIVLDLHRYRAPKTEYLKFWTDAATRYKNHPALIFDLMNEPHGISWEIWRNGGFVGEKQDTDQAAFLSAEEKAKAQGFESPGMQAMLDAVRATGAMNLVLVGGLDYAYDLVGIGEGFGLEDKSGHGIIYASHVYPWKKGWQKKFLDAAEKYPILLGEVGADSKKMEFMPAEIQEDAETWAPEMLGLIQKHKLHWTGWCFHPKATPRMILDWDYTPTPFWGQLAKDALAGKQFEVSRLR